jgi:gas vesicle protein
MNELSENINKNVEEMNQAVQSDLSEGGETIQKDLDEAKENIETKEKTHDISDGTYQEYTD